jgi:hypothetical protein
MFVSISVFFFNSISSLQFTTSFYENMCLFLFSMFVSVGEDLQKHQMCSVRKHEPNQISINLCKLWKKLFFQLLSFINVRNKLGMLGNREYETCIILFTHVYIFTS